jgi:hypothetical protein
VLLLPRGNLGKGSDEFSKQQKLNLALNQASDALKEATAERRSADTKLYGVSALSAALLGLLLSTKPWSSKSVMADSFFVAAFALYFITLVLGLKEYAPRDLSAANARAIVKALDHSYAELASWTTEYLLKFADEQYRIVNVKSRALKIMLHLFLIAAVCLVLGTLLY